MIYNSCNLKCGSINVIIFNEVPITVRLFWRFFEIIFKQVRVVLYRRFVRTMTWYLYGGASEISQSIRKVANICKYFLSSKFVQLDINCQNILVHYNEVGRRNTSVPSKSLAILNGRQDLGKAFSVNLAVQANLNLRTSRRN